MLQLHHLPGVNQACNQISAAALWLQTSSEISKMSGEPKSAIKCYLLTHKELFWCLELACAFRFISEGNLRENFTDLIKKKKRLKWWQRGRLCSVCGWRRGENKEKLYFLAWDQSPMKPGD